MMAIEIGLAQLLGYKKAGEGTPALDNDIEGYKIILATESRDNYVNFLELKHEAICKDEPFDDNLAIIKELKARGKWVVK